VSTADRASHVSGLGFDAAVWELWPYLASGARVDLAEDAVRSSPELLRDWLLEQAITVSFVPTPIADRLIALEWPREAALRVLLTGGDTLGHYPRPDLPFRLVNNYGPTECTVVATSGDVLPEADPEILPTIGRAIDGIRLYLLNGRLEPVAPGTAGEMFLGGAGVARGYRNQPDLTAERFLPDPFRDEPGARMYKTGDLARRLPDGQLIFAGRIDDQIKIRGYRIEPNEIMMALGRHPDIRESLVVAREDQPGERQLVAYIVLKTCAAVLHTALRDFLRETLPEYMIPVAFVRLDEFPLTSHGKVDREALPPPEFPAAESAPAARHTTPTQSRVAGIVAGLLGLESVAPDDNFFLLGGHSLLGAQLIAKLRAAFDLQISLRSLFAAPTVAALAREVERLAGARQAEAKI
jgi:acyl-coenzyme A synthetase/AMP-(fatty) acid ligase/acyl carrier protein